VYAIGALAGEPQAIAYYMELHKGEVARRKTAAVYAQEYSCAVCARIVFLKKIIHYDLSSRHVCNLPGAFVQ
jgi:hypothetical protein